MFCALYIDISSVEIHVLMELKLFIFTFVTILQFVTFHTIGSSRKVRILSSNIIEEIKFC